MNYVGWGFEERKEKLEGSVIVTQLQLTRRQYNEGDKS